MPVAQYHLFTTYFTWPRDKYFQILETL